MLLFKEFISYLMEDTLDEIAFTSTSTSTYHVCVPKLVVFYSNPQEDSKELTLYIVTNSSGIDIHDV